LRPPKTGRSASCAELRTSLASQIFFYEPLWYSPGGSAAWFDQRSKFGRLQTKSEARRHSRRGKGAKQRRSRVSPLPFLLIRNGKSGRSTSANFSGSTLIEPRNTVTGGHSSSPVYKKKNKRVEYLPSDHQS
jgi:hypothetical protein